MSRTGVGCRVMIDGAELDDGCIDWAAPPTDHPLFGEGLFATEGLTVTWGRSSTIDQPTPSSCTFRVIDDPGGVTYVSSLRVGAKVDVYADANLSGDATVVAFENGDFEGPAVAGVPLNATLARSTIRSVAPGVASARIVGTDPTKAYSATLAPGPIQNPGMNPAAWDTIITTTGGSTWSFEFDIYLPPLTTVRVRPVTFSGPYAAAATIVATPIAILGVEGWQHVTGSFSPGVTGAWVGINVEATGGATWADLPDDMTYATTPDDVVWVEYAAVYVDNVEILAPPGAPTTSILVFSGRITDLAAAWANEWGAPYADVTASDFLAELGNRYIGDEPWPLERLDERVVRILSDAEEGGEAIAADIAPTLAPTSITWMDVDRQAAANLLTDIAQSVDGVLWSATHIVTGPYLKLEDPLARISLFRLELVGGLITIVAVDFSGADPDVAPLLLSACDMLRDPVTFALDVSDVATRVAVEWLEQTVDDDGNPTTTGRRVLIVNAQREALVGSRSVSVSTVLATEADANTTADRILQRQSGDWRVAGVTVDDAEFEVPNDVAARAQLRLLNGVNRGGLPVQISDMPSWNPVGDPLPCYVEGGAYTFNGGGWELALTVSRATGLGQSAKWDDLDPTWTWDDWNPDYTWDDLRGVAGPALP